MKKFATVVIVFLIILPMVIYLNPFLWGMGRTPKYRSADTEYLLTELNEKYKVVINMNDNIDTLWYFRDIKNNKLTKLENFKLTVFRNSDNDLSKPDLHLYLKEFSEKFKHKKYFDSLMLENSSDSVIFKRKL